MITYKLPDGKLPSDISVYITPFEVTEVSIRTFKLELIAWHNNSYNKGKPLLIDICCNGGNTNDALSLRNTIELLKQLGHIVIGRVSGRAWSCASWILQACDFRIVANGAEIMFHEPRYTFEGKLSEQRRYLAETETLYSDTIGYLLTHSTKLQPEDVRRHANDGANWVIKGPEAVKFELADLAE